MTFQFIPQATLSGGNKLATLFTAFMKICGYLLLIFEDVKVILLAMSGLIIADQFTGVWKALKTRTWSWKKFNALYEKLILYLLAVIVMFLFEKYILEFSTHYLTQAVAIAIGFQEVSSTYLNICTITGKDVLKTVLKLLKTKIK